VAAFSGQRQFKTTQHKKHYSQVAFSEKKPVTMTQM